MTQNELDEFLVKHRKWIFNEEGGARAELNHTNLIGANLSNTDLRSADLVGAHLNNANLTNTDLRTANLIGADLRGAILIGANLTNAFLDYANLKGADLRDANLSRANLSNANLEGVYTIGGDTAFFHLQCPEKGSYIGYKKCRKNRIVELFIPADAKRSSATARKCRASKAKVLSITSLKGTIDFEMAFSFYDPSFVYKVGEIVEVEDFDENRWNECGAGIHHFITRDEAVNYI